jgi:hypothetical protein
MKKKSLYCITAFALTTFALVAVVPFVYATTIVNSVSVHSSTGGNAVQGTRGEDGQDGQEGQKGQDGENGQDGKYTSSQNKTSVSAKSVVNGVTIFESEENKKTQQHVPVDVISAHAVSVQNSVIETEGVAEVSVATEVATSHSTSTKVQNIFKTIHLIMMSYVNSLF